MDKKNNRIFPIFDEKYIKPTMKVRKVSEIIYQLEQAGWYLYRHNGSSHRQFKHVTIKGKVTVNGKLS